MNNVANLTHKQREELFIATSRDIDLPEAMTEKDFWICWTLYYLFNLNPWAKQLTLKGGTSLSKCFNLINRFSEDVDVILDWRILNYEKDDPWTERSRTKQDKFNKEMNEKTIKFLREQFLPCIKNDFNRLLADDFDIYIDQVDPHTVCFSYPRIFGIESILSIVRMEIGVLAAWTPTTNTIITPYSAQVFPEQFENPSTTILSVTPERTFWEKATILHKEAFRTDGRVPPRYSRHYYDIYCMSKSPVKDLALADLNLLEHVSRFKTRFYYSGSAHYDLAKPGTLRLIPSELCIPALMDDYEHMKNMIFGDQPDFIEILRNLQVLEMEINDI